MVRISNTIVALAFTIPASLAAQIAVSIGQPSFAFNPATLPSSTHATLHAAGAPLTAILNRANQFVFANVPSGSYLLEVHARDYVFEPLRVDVADEAGKEYVKSWQSFRGNEWDNKGEKRGEGEANVAGGTAKADLYVNVLGSKEYYAKRQGCKNSSYLYPTNDKANLNDSLGNEHIRQPDDSHRALLSRARGRHAIPDGEHGSRNKSRI